MTTTLQKWGNSQGVRIPKALLDKVGLEVGAELEVEANGKGFVITPTRPVRGRYTSEQLVADMPDGDPQSTELDWGPPVGEEVW